VSGNGGYGTPANNGGFPTVPTTTPLGPGSPGQPGQQTGQGYGTTPGSNQPNNGFGQPGAQTSASSMINNLLTQPRPGGAPTGLPGSLNGIGGTVVGGLAGVASTFKGRAIKTYNDQDEYSKWEFFYDLGAEQAAAVQNQMNQMNQKPAGSTSGQATSGQSSFGQSSFGQQPSGQQPSGQQTTPSQ
jgi:hypothetical protein